MESSTSLSSAPSRAETSLSVPCPMRTCLLYAALAGRVAVILGVPGFEFGIDQRAGREDISSSLFGASHHVDPANTSLVSSSATTRALTAPFCTSLYLSTFLQPHDEVHSAPVRGSMDLPPRHHPLLPFPHHRPPRYFDHRKTSSSQPTLHLQPNPPNRLLQLYHFHPPNPSLGRIFHCFPLQSSPQPRLAYVGDSFGLLPASDCGWILLRYPTASCARSVAVPGAAAERCRGVFAVH